MWDANLLNEKQVHLEWREGKKVTKCNLTSPCSPTRDEQRIQKHLINAFEYIEFLYKGYITDYINLTITQELTKI